MAISITTTDPKTTSQDARKTRNVYDNLDNLRAVVHYDASDNVDYVLETSNNSSGKALENTKFHQIQVDVVESPSDITNNSVTLKARIYKNDNSKVQETGFVVWTGDGFESVVGKTEYSNVITTPVVLKGNFTKAISNLSESTTYNYRAYVKHEYGTNYSKVHQFTTLASNLIFAIAGNKFSGPAPLTVSLSAINAGAGVSSYAWNLTGGQTPQFTTQIVNYTYLSAGTFTARASAIMGSGAIKTATRQIIATGTTNYTAEWSNALASSYGNNIVGAYDFRNVPNSSLKNGLLAFWKLDDLTDSSGNGNDLTNNEDAQFVAGKVGDGAEFNGTNSLTVLNPDTTTVNTKSFSFWVKRTTSDTNQQGLICGLIAGYYIHTQNNKLSFWPGTGSDNPESGATLPVDTWVHCVVIYNNPTLKFYINGVLDTNVSLGVNASISQYTNICLGAAQQGQLHFTGEMDAAGIWNRALTEEEIDLLYNSGTGTESIGTTVDAIVGPDLTLVGNTVVETDGDPFFNDVSLLLNMNGTSGSQVFVDSSTNAYSVTASGNTAINTTIFKYGNGSTSFNGNSSNYISLSSNPDFAFNEDFTIEGWFYFNQNNIGYQPLLAAYSNGDSTGWILTIETNNTLNFYGSPGSNWDLALTSNYIPPTNQWIHIAVSRNQGSISLFVNGALQETTNNNTSIVAGNTVAVGHYPYFPDFPRSFNGYIDDVRITKGVGRYIANFTPPEAELPNIVGNNIGVKFIPAPAWAETTETVATTYPHTLVLVAKADSLNTGDVIYLANQPVKWEQTSSQNFWIFSRTSQGIMPYSGNDNQNNMNPSYTPDGTEWFYLAYSFLNNGTVRYHLVTPNRNSHGTVPGAVISGPFNGYLAVGRAGGASDTSNNVYGTMRLGMFINDDFSTVEEMNTLFAQITAGPANGLLNS